MTAESQSPEAKGTVTLSDSLFRAGPVLMLKGYKRAIGVDRNGVDDAVDVGVGNRVEEAVLVAEVVVDQPVGCTNSIVMPRPRIRGAVRRGGRADGPEACKGSLSAEDRFRRRDPAVAGRALGVDAAG
jgi:hypothetical protein